MASVYLSCQEPTEKQLREESSQAEQHTLFQLFPELRKRLAWRSLGCRWVNYMQYPTPYSQGFYLSATSKSPTGPWTIANRNITMTQKQPAILCDFDLLLDDDGTAYIIYTVWRPQGLPHQATHMSVEQLTPDFTSSTLNASAVFTGPAASGDEAPVIFRRKGTRR